MAMSIFRPPTGAATTTAPFASQPQSPALFQTLNDAVQSANREALAARIPGLAGLEQSSSAAIAGLLNPPAFYSDVDRRSAELAAGRGVPGSALGFGVGLKMTDDERLRRLTLGQNMLTQATARNPVAAQPDILSTILTPAQQAELALKQQALGQDYQQNQAANALEREKLALANRELGLKYGVTNSRADKVVEDQFIQNFLYGNPTYRTTGL